MLTWRFGIHFRKHNGYWSSRSISFRNADQGACICGATLMAVGIRPRSVCNVGQAADDALGASNQISGSTLVVEPLTTRNAAWQGVTFTLTGGSWIQTQDFEAPDAVNGDTFGTYVGNSGRLQLL